MKDTRLFEIFYETKQILCKYDYYIHTSKKILHLTNSELKLPHLMGLQYIGRKDLYTGDNGAYAIKKGKLTMSSMEKFVRKFYKSKEKQEQILKLNTKFGTYHTVDMLNSSDSLLAQCKDKREESLVKDFLNLWQ
ncbi:MAG: PBECR4 domain-containing protein [Lachnospiraceae bacterium]|nr:PBECR4 domain-containing protein [Lachnospiraceae bacterium]